MLEPNINMEYYFFSCWIRLHSFFFYSDKLISIAKKKNAGKVGLQNSTINISTITHISSSYLHIYIFPYPKLSDVPFLLMVSYHIFILLFV